jgi:hypothetical protein
VNLSSHPNALNARSPHWTLAEDKTLREAIIAGKRIPDLVKLLPDRSPRSIQTRARRIGVPITLRSRAFCTRQPENTDAEILRLCGYLKSDSTIADYVGCSRERVAALRAGLKAEKRRTMAGFNDLAGEPIEPRVDVGAIKATKALRDRMIALFERQATAAGVSTEIAMLANLAGRGRAGASTTTKEMNFAR